MKLDSFDALFLHELQDLYSAEKQLVAALPKMAKGASSEELKRPSRRTSSRRKGTSIGWTRSSRTWS